ncbi:unnamed protein product [Diatraea saccharalis]|uniref:Uncharacterized protein n=1 Tax=Diatraea saccharalis TaxID=40085 RepID=A0A9N9REY6_9NEOP|nr:unnamed protein product [Diatraea saccharalis]
MQNAAATQPGMLKSTDNVTPQQATSTAQTNNAGQVGKPGALNKNLLAAFQGPEQKNDQVNQSNKPQPAPKISITTSQPNSDQKTQVNNIITHQPVTTTSPPNNPSQANKPQPLPKKLNLSFQTTTEQNNNPTSDKPQPTTKKVSLTISKENPTSISGQQTNISQPIQSKTFELSFQTGKDQNNAQFNRSHATTAQSATGLNNIPTGQSYNPQPQTNNSQPVQSKTYNLSFQTAKEQNNSQFNPANATQMPPKENLMTSQQTSGLNNSPAGQPYNSQSQTKTEFQSTSQTNQQPHTPDENTTNERRRRNKNINVDCCCDESCCLYNCCCCEAISNCFKSCFDGIASCFSAMCCCCSSGESGGDGDGDCCTCADGCCDEDCCTCCADACCGCCEDFDWGECCENFWVSLFSCGGE